jgi:hypothetical protein
MTRLLLMFFALVNTSIFAQSDPFDTMHQAEIAYISGGYDTAKVLYEGLLQAGIRDPVIYFNLGNSYYQLGDMGRALLNYRRVQLFWPRDVAVNDNLRRVLAERVDLQGDEVGFAESLATLTTSIVTIEELGIVVGLIWAVWLGLVSSIILRRSLVKKMMPLRILIGLLLLLGLGLLGNAFVINTSRPAGIIIEANVRVMSGPGENYMEIFDLHSGADIRIWKVENGWIQFAVPDGRLGWLPQSVVGFVRE